MRLQRDLALQHGFAGNLMGLDGILYAFAAAQQDHVRVVKLDQLGSGAVGDAQNGKGGIGHLPHAAHRQCFHNGIHTVFNGHAARDHGAQDLARQRGEDICLYTAAKAVRQHHCQRAVVLADHLYAVAAKLFACVVQADGACLCK